MNQRILVTGGSGFIGSHIVEVSGARAADELGCAAQTRFAAGADRYVSWYRSQHPEPDPLIT